MSKMQKILVVFICSIFLLVNLAIVFYANVTGFNITSAYKVLFFKDREWEIKKDNISFESFGNVYISKEKDDYVGDWMRFSEDGSRLLFLDLNKNTKYFDFNAKNSYSSDDKFQKKPFQFGNETDLERELAMQKLKPFNEFDGYRYCKEPKSQTNKRIALICESDFYEAFAHDVAYYDNIIIIENGVANVYYKILKRFGQIIDYSWNGDNFNFILSRDEWGAKNGNSIELRQIKFN